MIRSILIMPLRLVKTVLLSRTAYIGAGTGSLIIQIVIASSLGFFVTIGIYWSRIRRYFSRNKGEEDSQPFEPDE